MRRPPVRRILRPPAVGVVSVPRTRSGERKRGVPLRGGGTCDLAPGVANGKVRRLRDVNYFRTWIVLFILLVIPVEGALEAWACVPQPLVVLSPQASGPPGSRVTVNGLAVAGTVEIRWNGIDGPRLAQATGPNFSADVTIPEASEGLYVIIVAERKPDGGLGSTGRAAFYVTGQENSANSEPMSPSDSMPGNTTSTLTAELPQAGASGSVLFATGMGLGAIAVVLFSRHYRR